MRTTPTLFPLLRSELVARSLGLLFISGKEYRAKDIAEALGVTKAAMTQPLQYMLQSGAVTVRTDGRNKYVSADVTSPVYEPLRQLLMITYGPPAVVGAELGTVPGVVDGYIFGSWAARDAGVAGPAPNDIDVLVVSDGASFSEVSAACTRASTRLGREVNPVIKNVSQWDEPDAFVRTLLEGPTKRLDLGEASQEGSDHGSDSVEESRSSASADSDWTADFGLERL